MFQSNHQRGVLLTEQEHQQEWQEEEAGAARQRKRRVMVALHRVIGQGAKHNENRDGDDDAEGGREPVE